MILSKIYSQKVEYSILSQLTRANRITANKKNLLNMTNIEYKFSHDSNNIFSYLEKEVFFIINHGGGIPTVLIKPKPIIQTPFSERRVTIDTYIKLVRSSFSLNLYENKKIILMAVCFAAKKPTFGNDILAVELAKKLRIHVIASDSVVSIHSFTRNEYNYFNITRKKEHIRDISTNGNWYLIDPLGQMKQLDIPSKNDSLAENGNFYSSFKRKRE